MRELDVARPSCGAGVLTMIGVLSLLAAGPVSADPLDDYYALEDRIAEAQELHLQATRGKEPSGGASARVAILKKMDALADATAGKPGGAPIAAGTFFWSWNLDLDLEKLHGRFDRVAKQFPDHSVMGDVLTAVPPAALATGPANGWISTLERLTAKTKREETKLGAMFAAAQIHLGAKDMPQAKSMFAKVRAAGPTSALAEQAKGFIHEIEHLQVGMIAPDFVTKTLDGKDLALKSLRGKAVLLNFWASW